LIDGTSSDLESNAQGARPQTKTKAQSPFRDVDATQLVMKLAAFCGKRKSS
jgi:hypothetical protein